MILNRVGPGYTPPNVSVMTSTVSTPCPTTVDPTVRVQSLRPLVRIFNLAIVYELANSPTQYATSDAANMRGINPNTVANACWLFHPGAPGSAITAALRP